MKYIEKAIEICPDLKKEEILKKCPTDFNIMKIKCETFADSCEECWHRSLPLDTARKGRVTMGYRVMKQIFLIGLSLIFAYVSWLLYKAADSWNFSIAFMGGAVAMGITLTLDRYFQKTNKR